MRFFLDQDVSATVGVSLRAAGHDAWAADQAGLSRALDDELTVYAQSQKAVLVTHDREFSRRRRKNVVGWHLLLRCNEWDGADLLINHIQTVEALVRSHDDIYIAISEEGCDLSLLGTEPSIAKPCLDDGSSPFALPSPPRRVVQAHRGRERLDETLAGAYIATPTRRRSKR